MARRIGVGFPTTPMAPVSPTPISRDSTPVINPLQYNSGSGEIRYFNVSNTGGTNWNDIASPSSPLFVPLVGNRLIVYGKTIADVADPTPPYVQGIIWYKSPVQSANAFSSPQLKYRFALTGESYAQGQIFYGGKILEISGVNFDGIYLYGSTNFTLGSSLDIYAISDKGSDPINLYGA
jgi:hypothetical protein